MQRICVLPKVRTSQLEKYRRAYEDIWPEMQDALRTACWSNYSLFLCDDGLLVGYLNAANFDEARRRMAEAPVNARWQAEMAPFFEDLDGQRPDHGLTVLSSIFHLP